MGVSESDDSASELDSDESSTIGFSFEPPSPVSLKYCACSFAAVA